MKNTMMGKYRQHGFTLFETLLVTAIVICLAAISLVGVVKYMRHLQITELDYAAREIYMAAQNRAVLLKNSEQLSSCVILPDNANRMDYVEVPLGQETATQITAYFVHSANEAAMEELLPAGSIDPALWGEGTSDFYIVYEPDSGSVLDVFYARESLSVSDGDFRSFYDTWGGGITVVSA